MNGLGEVKQMARAIDAEALVKKLKECRLGENSFVEKIFADGVYAVIDTMPTIYPVIRCRDCAVPHNKWTGCPKLNGLVPPDDFYCAFGERDGE